jgi:hypothetical protein
MDVPILTAVIGVTGTLLGTIVGGCLTTFTNFLLQKRREEAEFRIGCRLIIGEMQEIYISIASSLDTKEWWPSELELGMKAWEEHQHVLASYLPYEEWRAVRSAILMVRIATFLSVNARAAKTETLSDEDAQRLTTVIKDIQKGQAILRPYTRKPYRRLLEPLRIRPLIPGPPVLR